MTDFSKTKSLFHLPEGVIYLDGNSLGPLPKSASKRVADMMQDEWGELLIRGWNKAGWMDQPTRVGNRIAKLVGAQDGTIVMGETLSIKVYQAIAAALSLTERKVILSDNGNFPSDLYMVEGLIKALDQGHELRIVDPEAVEDAITNDVGVLMLTEVDYRSGRKHDMDALTKKAHAVGTLTVWDLAHSAGALPVHLTDTYADFAVGCTYKYLNGGPGAPAFIYVAPKHADTIKPALSGWLGHASPFAFDLDYTAGQGIERMRVGTPPVIALASLEAALDAWDKVDLNDLRESSIALCDQFINQVEAKCPTLTLFSPRDGVQRGSQISFAHPEGYAIMQALISKGVIGDFRAPNLIRFGFTPLYVDASDVTKASDILADIMANDLWDTPEFKTKAAVT